MSLTSRTPVDPTAEWPDVASSTDDYAARFQGAVGRYFLGVQLDGVLAGLAGAEVQTVVDVGGGHAQLAVPLSARALDVTVLGSSAACEARLHRLMPRGGYRFVRGPLHPAPFSDQSFDAVTAVRMLAHMTDEVRFLRELCRIARRRVIVDFPVRRVWDSLGTFGFALKKGVEGNTRTYRTFSAKRIASVLNDEGFRVIQQFRQFALPMALHRAADSLAVSRWAETVARSVGLTRWVGSPVLMVAERIGTEVRQTGGGE